MSLFRIKSQWLSGLLYAESLAQQGKSNDEINHEIDMHIFGNPDDFDRGAMDYTHHMKRLAEVGLAE